MGANASDNFEIEEQIKKGTYIDILGRPCTEKCCLTKKPELGVAVFEQFYEDGTKHIQGHYKNNKPIGWWYVYNHNDILHGRMIYIYDHKFTGLLIDSFYLIPPGY